jgi:hypothetical protein
MIGIRWFHYGYFWKSVTLTGQKTFLVILTVTERETDRALQAILHAFMNSRNIVE